MTWPAGIALAIGILAALLITIDQHKHRSTNRTQHIRRTENCHGHQNPQDHRQEDNRA